MLFSTLKRMGEDTSAAIDMANEFLSADKTIVYTEGSKRPRYTEKSRGNGEFQTGRVVVFGG